MLDSLAPYSKALAAAAVGLALVVAGVLVGEDSLKQLGYGALAVSLPVFATSNGPQAHAHEGDPPDDDGATTLGTPLASVYDPPKPKRKPTTRKKAA